MSGSKKTGGRPIKKINVREREFADLIIDSKLGPIEAARKIFGWRCEPGSAQYSKAMNLRKSKRVSDYIKKREEQIIREVEAHKLFIDKEIVEWDSLRKFAFERLEHIRDDVDQKSANRFTAIQAIEKLTDPSSDISLINMWLDLLWRGMLAHCPRCHSTFPLRKIKNENIDSITEDDPLVDVETVYDRRMEIIKRSDPRKTPHKSQVIALSAPERHVAGSGAARAGKSVLLAWMALLFFLIPGVEIWILARVYDDARSEVDYLRKFLRTLFYPYGDKIVKESFDSKTGELSLVSKWGSELRVRSAKAKGSITARELEAALIAEPGWVPEDLYEEIRARMSSRLGRIIMFGTPKGFGGILGRMINMTGRDPQTGQVIRIPPEQRTIESGCPWSISLRHYQLDPKDNPEYVKSELKSARMELLDSEYASEFEGLMSTQEGSKFPAVQTRHLVNLRFTDYQDCVFVLGIDQGPKNFAGVLLGYDGKKIFVAREYFETDDRTMKYHMAELRRQVPVWIQRSGGQDGSWKLTIFDVDPPLLNELSEFEREGMAWPTEVTFRPKNQRGQFNQFNWRPETYEFLNQLAAPEDPNILFDLQHCSLIHDQVMRTQNNPENRDRDDTAPNAKRWIVNDPWRGDHVLDALMLALWTIYSNQIKTTNTPAEPGDALAEAKAAFEYQRRVQEARELTGFVDAKVKEDDVFLETFGRPRKKSWNLGIVGHYKDY